MMKQDLIQIRIDKEDKELIQANAKKFGFNSISEYLRYVGKNCQEIKISVKGE